MAKTALEIKKDRLSRSHLDCGYCCKPLEEVATISSLIMEDCPVPAFILERMSNAKAVRIFCSQKCLIYFRLNGNLNMMGNHRVHNPLGSFFRDKLNELQYHLERKAEKEENE